MEMLRLYVSRSLALAAAIVLIAAGIRAAQAGTDILNQMLSFDAPSAIQALREVLLLAAIALATGICAILVAPRSTVGRYKIVGGKIVHDIRDIRDVPDIQDIRQAERGGGATQSAHDGFAHAVEMNASTRPDMVTVRSASHSHTAPMPDGAGESPPPREEVSPRGR